MKEEDIETVLCGCLMTEIVSPNHLLFPKWNAEVMCLSQPSEMILPCLLMIWLNKLISELSALTTLIFSDLKLSMK